MDDIATLVQILFSTKEINETGRTIIQVTLVISMIISLLQCFLGYKMIKFWISLNGFFIGMILGSIIGVSTNNYTIAIILSIGFAVLGAWLAFKLYKLGVFLQCFTLGVLLGLIIGMGICISSKSENYYIIIPICLILGITAGILGVILIKPVFIIMTGISGGTSAGSSLALLLSMNDMTMGVILGLLFAAAGIFVQFMTNKKVNNIPPQAAYPIPSPAFNGNQFQPANVSYTNDNQAPAPASQPQLVSQPTEADKFCPNCGQPCGTDSKFCKNCGQRLNP